MCGNLLRQPSETNISPQANSTNSGIISTDTQKAMGYKLVLISWDKLTHKLCYPYACLACAVETLGKAKDRLGLWRVIGHLVRAKGEGIRRSGKAQRKGSSWRWPQIATKAHLIAYRWDRKAPSPSDLAELSGQFSFPWSREGVGQNFLFQDTVSPKTQRVCPCSPRSLPNTAVAAPFPSLFALYLPLQSCPLKAYEDLGDLLNFGWRDNHIHLRGNFKAVNKAKPTLEEN